MIIRLSRGMTGRRRGSQDDLPGKGERPMVRRNRPLPACGRAAMAVSLWVVLAACARAGGPATGPLRRLESNPRYFTDGSGKAILLAGSHNWHNFQDNGHRLPTSDDPP